MYFVSDVSIATGQIERAGALRDARASLYIGYPSYWNTYPAVDGDGDRAVFVGAVNPTDGNPDL